MARSSFLCCTLVAALVFSVTPRSSAVAQDSVLADLYGAGVHAYYNNDYARAHDLLSQAINGGLEDPRVYYFRGLTRQATGRPQEAEADFREGAEIEALGTFGPAVSRALTRVQGSTRIKIETIRKQARLEKHAEGMARAERRYSERQRAEAQALRSEPSPRTPPPLPGRRPTLIPAEAADTVAEADRPRGEPRVQSRDALADAMTDPFQDDDAPAAADRPAAEAPDADPFAAPPADADPFATDDDPFAP